MGLHELGRVVLDKSAHGNAGVEGDGLGTRDHGEHVVQAASAREVLRQQPPVQRLTRHLCDQSAKQGMPRAR